MSEGMFRISLIVIAVLFSLFFLLVFIPPIIANPDLVGVFLAGFDNPYVTGYSVDLITCWFVLILWVWFEAKNNSIKHGWICVLLGLVPGVAVGFSLYLLLRYSQLKKESRESDGLQGS